MTRLTCPAVVVGCTFAGTAEEVDEHLVYMLTTVDDEDHAMTAPPSVLTARPQTEPATPDSCPGKDTGQHQYVCVQCGKPKPV